jgi:hypothetical protein
VLEEEKAKEKRPLRRGTGWGGKELGRAARLGLRGKRGRQTGPGRERPIGGVWVLK